MNKKDKFENGLRERLGGARSEPPSHVWERISETLREQGLTAAAPKHATNMRRMRKLGIGWAAAAAVLIAAILVFNPQHTDTNKVLISENLPELPETTPELIVSPEMNFSPEINVPPADDGGTDRQTIRTSAINGGGEILPDNIPADHHKETVPVKTENAQQSENAQPLETVNNRPETVPVEESGKNEPASVPARQWADRDEIVRALGSGAGKRGTGGMSVGLYSANIGSRSTEKIVQSTPYARVTSSFVAQETANAAFNSSTRAAESTVLKHRIPLSAGISVTKGLAGRFSLESGLTYSYLFSKGESSLSGSAYRIKEQHLHYVGIPVGIKYDMFRSSYVDIYASASGLFEMCVYSKQNREVSVNGVSGETETNSLNVRGIQPSVWVGAGAEVKISRRLGIYVEPGFSYYFDIEKQPESFRTENPLNFAFSAGLRVNFK